MGKADVACHNARNHLCQKVSQSYFHYMRLASPHRARMNKEAGIVKREANVMKKSGCGGKWPYPTF